MTKIECICPKKPCPFCALPLEERLKQTNCCTSPDVDVPGIRCGHPLPCPRHMTLVQCLAAFPTTDEEVEEMEADLGPSPPLDPEFVERTTKEVKSRIRERMIAKEILEDKAKLDALPERSDEFVLRSRIHRLQGKIAMAGMDLAALVMGEED